MAKGKFMHSGQVLHPTLKRTAMPKHFQFTIPTPCAEDWQNMTPVEKGRHCSMCRKNVVDFTDMSDREILQHFNKATAPVCGRFYPDQINRDMVARKESRLPWLKYFFQFSLPAFILSMKTVAQDKKPATEQVQQEARDYIIGDSIFRAPGQWVVKGNVVDEDGRAVLGASVMIKGTNKGTVTDEQGNFKLVFADDTSVKLLISFVGFTQIELAKVMPEKESIAKPVNVKMKYSVMGMVGEIVVVKKKKPKRTAFEKVKSILTPDSVKVFPNPIYAGGDMNIELMVKDKGEHIISVMDYSGKLVSSSVVMVNDKTMKTSISTRQLLPGNYTVSIHNRWGKNIGTKKIIVQ